LELSESDLVILIGDDDDPHIVAVGAALKGRDVACMTVGANANFGLVTARLGGGRVTPVLDMDGTAVPLDAVVGVLDRGRSSFPVLTDEGWQYVFRERKAFLEALPALAPRARWLNDPAGAIRASNKIAQLIAAQRAGFRVPPTYVTNDIEAIGGLLAETRGDIVFKALTWLATIDGRALFTNRLEPSIPEQFATALRPAPVIFQGRVQKRDELRVTCIGEQSFGVRIDSQERPDTWLDWRRNQQDVYYEVAALPEALGDRLQAVMTDLGISFGAFDLARDDDGEIVFFEVNPAGNWLWLEERLDLPISEAVADWLATAVDSRPACLE
jgi:glutathione synthase/RimK-type ligase-like ATP-grasp enzyme